MQKILTHNQKKCIDITTTLNEIGAPLLQGTHIKYYTYCRVLNNGSYALVSTYADWLSQYYAQQFSLPKTIEECPNIIKQHFSLWCELADSSVVQFTCANFDAANGISFFEQQDDCMEFFHFCSDRNAPNLTNWYLNNINLLTHFISFLRTHVDKLLQRDFLTKISPQEVQHIRALQNQAKQAIDHEEQRFKAFYMNTKIQSANLHVGEQSIGLNQREIECLRLLVQGCTAKSAAKKLYLSPRTVEYYVGELKKKFHCQSKSALIQMVHDSGIIDKVA